MTVNGISNQPLYEKIKNTSTQKNQRKGFQERLYDSLSQETGSDNYREVSDDNQTSTSVNEYLSTQSISSKMTIQYDTGRVNASAVLECSAKNISYRESDNVKVCLEEGYTFKAQVDITGHKVYIEQKNEDGTVKAYEVNPLKLDKNTDNPMEQMALESWEMARKSMAGDSFTEVNPEDLLAATGMKPLQEQKDTKSEQSSVDNLMGMSLEEAMLAFYDYVEERIKNGDPKIPIGGSEMSVKEWDKLLEKIDGNLEDIKEELEERIRKIREEKGESVSDDTDSTNVKDSNKDSINTIDGTQETSESEKPGMTAYYDGIPLETWALTDQRYTDKVTGISWYVVEGRSPYLIGEDAEKFQKLCEETGENPAKKLAEMTGLMK